jgi:histone H3/H4
VKKEDAEEFTRSLGQIVGGAWRQINLAERLGVPRALRLSTKEWVNERLGGYAKEVAAQILEAKAEGLGIKAIARATGAARTTVRKVIRGSKSPLADSAIKDLASKEGSVLPLHIDAIAAISATNKVVATSKAAKTRQSKENQRKADLERPVSVKLPPGVHHGDFYELSKQIADQSVELVFTDPPYDGSSIVQYEKAAEVAARILKPGASLVMYCGQRHLPDVLLAMRSIKRLTYWWTCAGIHEGGNQILQKLGVRCGWKPLVWFVKETRGDVQNVMLDIVRGDREKDTHEWQQSLEEARYFVERLCPQSGCVVDFFLGGGTTRVAAEELGRRFIGFEVSARAIENAVERSKVAA